MGVTGEDRFPQVLRRTVVLDKADDVNLCTWYHGRHVRDLGGPF